MPAELKLFVLLAPVLLALGAPPASAQDLHPSRRLSPVGIAKGHVGDTYVKVTYGRPYMRDRAIFGMDEDVPYLVPYGEVWRTGANEATEITLTGPLHVAGEPLDAGTYSIFTVPGPTSWRIHFSPQLGLDGTGRMGPDGAFMADVYDPSRDVLVVEVPASSLDEDVDPLTMAVEPTPLGARLVLRWERTEVSIPLEDPGS